MAEKTQPIGSDVAREAAHEFVAKHQTTIYTAVLDALVDDGRKRLRILNDAEVLRRTSLNKKQRRKMEAAGEFPSRVPLTPRLDGYLEEEIEKWIEERLTTREEELSKRRSPNPLARTNKKALARDARQAAIEKANVSAAEDDQTAGDASNG